MFKPEIKKTYAAFILQTIGVGGTAIHESEYHLLVHDAKDSLTNKKGLHSHCIQVVIEGLQLVDRLKLFHVQKG